MFFNVADLSVMAYKGSFYYDEFDYENYPESLEYDTDNEQLPSFSDVLFCGFSVSKQIALQLLCLLCVNFIYRLIRQSSESMTVCDDNRYITVMTSFRSSRILKAFVFFFARIFLNFYLLHEWQLFHSPACLRFLCFLKVAPDCKVEATRFSRDSVSDCVDFHMVS